MGGSAARSCLFRSRRVPRFATALTLGLLPGCTNHGPTPRLDGSVPAPQLSALPGVETLVRLPAQSGEKAELSGGDAARSEISKAWDRPPSTYAEAIRLRDFPAARALIEAAPQEERALAEVRYALGYVALELRDSKTALEALEALEKEAPEFAADAARLRAEAHRIAGNADEVVGYYGRRRDVESWLVAARALADAERYAEARKWVDKSITALGRRRSLELRAEARALRARIAEAQKHRYQAINDYRWLATEAPTTPAADGADGALVRFGDGLALTKLQRLARARAFAEAGNAQRAERELEALARAPGREPSEGDKVAVLAQAVYRSRSDYGRAAELYGRAAELSPKSRDLHRFLEAKSLARAQRDTEAARKYDELAKRLPQTQIGDDALYEAARLRFIDGYFTEAVAGYESYLRRRSKTGRHAESVRYELAIARLATKEFEKAERALRALLDDGKLRQREEARLLELIGVAEQGAGKREAAIATFHRVIQLEPLSFAALAAAARLEEMGAPVPAPIAAAPSLPPPPPLFLELPAEAAKLHRVGLDAEAELAMREAEAKIEQSYGERAGEALCRMYGQLESARRRYQLAQRVVSRRALDAAPGPGTRWQWECVYPEPYAAIIERAEKERELSPHLLHAVMRQESGFSPTVVSPAEAVGLLQLIEPTARRVADALESPFDAELMRAPAVNVRFGAYYLRELMNVFGGRVELAAAAYNAGPHAAGRWLDAGHSLPLDVFVARIPYAETRLYVQRVIGNWARYAYLHGGEAAVPKLSLALPQGIQVPADAY